MSEIEWLERTFFPHVKDLKARGETAFLCGVSDGRGKVCGRDVSRAVVPAPEIKLVVSLCPKHGGVVCATPEFLAATNEHRTAVHFHRPKRAPDDGDRL